jgi:Ulp1 family protease
MIVIPVLDESRHHWVLVVVDLKSKIITVANSMRGAYIKGSQQANPMEEYVQPLLQFFQMKYPAAFRTNYSF